MSKKKLEKLSTTYFGILHLFYVIHVAWADTLLFIKVHLTSSILILFLHLIDEVMTNDKKIGFLLSLMWYMEKFHGISTTKHKPLEI